MARGPAGVLISLANETDLSYEPVDLRRRMRIQKSVYLLKELGYRPVSSYSFNLYVHGPYSPDLARDYYLMMEKGARESNAVRIPRDALEAVRTAVKKGPRFMEAATSLHLIANANPKRTKDELFRHFGWVKPSLKGKAEEAWEFLEAHNLLPGPI